jgi:hypothetical protein
LEVPRGVHVLKVDASPVLLGIDEHGVRGGGVADVRGPDAREGRYWVAHDARGEQLWLVVPGGEAVWCTAGLTGELAEDGVRGLVVSDYAAAMALCEQGKREERKKGGKRLSIIPRFLSDERVAPQVV